MLQMLLVCLLPAQVLAGGTPNPSTNTGTEAIQENHSSSAARGQSVETVIHKELYYESGAEVNVLHLPTRFSLAPVVADSITRV